MQQHNLFDPDRTPYQPASETSRLAAAAITGHAAAQERRVLAHLAGRPVDGANQWEMHDATGLERSSLCARCNALEGRGLVERRRDRDGRFLTRPTLHNRPACVYWITDRGRAALGERGAA